MADDLIVMAVLLGAHGVKGDCRVKSFTGAPEDAFGYGPLLGVNGDVLLTPLRARAVKDHFIVTPEEARQKEEWDGLKGTLLHVSRDTLPPTQDDEIYIDELVGVAVFDAEGRALGHVKTLQNYGAGDLLEITPIQGRKTVLVPFTQDDVPEIDLDADRIIVATYDLWADENDAPPEPDAGAEGKSLKEDGQPAVAPKASPPKAGPKKKKLKR